MHRRDYHGKYSWRELVPIDIAGLVDLIRKWQALLQNMLQQLASVKTR